MFCNFSEALLRFSELLQYQNESNLSIIDYLNSTEQTAWVLSVVTGYWKAFWNTPLQMILTKWGFCFSFNLMPLPELFNLEKYFNVTNFQT
jgi:hypothetical protein